MRDEVLTELRSLRKGTGMTLAKLEKCPALLNICGSPQSAYDLITASVVRLGDGVKARALGNALAIGMQDPRNLTQRRDDFGMANDSRHKDTVESYENEMLEELASMLLSKSLPVPINHVFAVHVHLTIEDGVITSIGMDRNDARIIGGKTTKRNNWFIYLANPSVTADLKLFIDSGPVSGSMYYYRDIYDWQINDAHSSAGFSSMWVMEVPSVTPESVIEFRF